MIPENEVSLSSSYARIVILFKIGVPEGKGTHLFKFVIAVLLKTLSYHLGGHASLKILILFYLLILHAQELLVSYLKGLLFILGTFLFRIKPAFELLKPDRALIYLLILIGKSIFYS